MKAIILLSTLLVATAYAFTGNLADIKVPTANEVGSALAKSEDALLRQAGENMLVPANDTTVPPLGLPCKSSTQAVGPCSVALKVCPHVHHFKLRYRADACTSGVCATSSDTKSGSGAAKDGIYKLMLKHPSCACGAGNTTIGSCNFKINSCFQLDSSCTTPSFFASATCTNNAVSADYCCAATGEDAAKAAMTALAGKMNMTACM